MPAPPNETAATAAAMTVLPYSTSLDVSGATSPNFDVWWSYTAQDGDSVIGFWAFSEVGGTYDPVTTVWTGPDAGTLSQYLSITAANKPLQLPVTSGTTYWFRVRQSNSGVAPNIALTVSALAASADEVPAGSLLINDDTPGFPVALLSASTGEALRFVNDFPAGEAGDVLPTGEVLVTDEFVGFDFQLWDDQLTAATNIAWPWTGTPTIRTHNPSGKWYIGYSGLGITPAAVTTLSAGGVLGGTTWTLDGPGLVGMAASADETVLYFAGTGGSTNVPIRRWDLVNDVALTDLAAAEPGYRVGDILVLDDDSVVVLYFDNAAPRDLFVRRYDAAGATLNTYSFGSDLTSTLPRLAYSSTAGRFWVWWHSAATAGQGVLKEVVASSGAYASEVTTVEYEGGVYEGAETASPSARFGNSYSCPLVVLRASIAAPIPPTPTPSTPTYTTEDIPRRRLRRFTHLSADEVWLYFSRLQVVLETGVGLVSGQGEDPQIMLRWSDDGGHTWSNEHWVSAGRMGEYARRAIWRRLGRGRDRVFELVVSDPVPWRLIGSVLDVDRGTA